jgi:hypothetical protein
MQLIWILLIVLPIGSWAQAGNGVQKFHAFYTITYKGNIPVDEQGNVMDDGIDTIYTLLVEVKIEAATQLQFTKVYAGGRWVKPTKQLSVSDKVVVGYDRENNKEITVSPMAGNILIPVHLAPGAYASMPKGVPKAGLWMQGKYNGKTTTWIIQSLTVLPSIYYP